MRVPPWYSICHGHRGVYHNNTRCAEGARIEARCRREGTAGRLLCEACARHASYD